MIGSTLLVLAVLVIAALVAWRRRARLWAAGLALVAWLPAATLAQQIPGWILGLAAGPVLMWVWKRRIRSAAIVTRWSATARRKSGVASSTDILRRRGTLAMRRRAGIVRPSLRLAGKNLVLRWWARVVQLVTLPAREVAVELCRTGRTRVWAPVEDVVLVFGPPRQGKSQWLAGRIIDAPGAVIATSTRTDLLDQIGPLRAQLGPVFVFNPVGLGARPSTITFDPLIGCEDPVTAAERASDMLAGTGTGYKSGGSGDREFWDDQGRRNLAALMHAAALGGLSMDEVATWLATLKQSQSEILGLLRSSPEQAFVASIMQFIGTNDRTLTSITSTIAPALGWLTHAPARAAALPRRDGGQPFNVAGLLQSKATVFMLGGEEAQVAPLVCALTGYVAREARRLAAFMPGGRLDPPLALRLDEAALICPVPLHQWTADMGGRGVSIVACFQSRAQMLDRYGDAKSATIINNSGGRVLFGGTTDRDDLGYWSTVAGERDEVVDTVDGRGRVLSRSVRSVPVLPPALLATMPPGRVVVFTRDMAPVIGTAEQAWQRHDVRAFHNPDALTVRTRARVHRQATQLTGRSRAVVAATCSWIAHAGRRGSSWVASRAAVMWFRVTGRGYQAPKVVPGDVVTPSSASGRPAEVIPFPSPGTSPGPGTGAGRAGPSWLYPPDPQPGRDRHGFPGGDAS